MSFTLNLITLILTFIVLAFASLTIAMKVVPTQHFWYIVALVIDAGICGLVQVYVLGKVEGKK